MENVNKKILTVSFAIAGALLAFVLSMLISAFAGIFGWMARLAGQDLFKHGLPITVGILLFLFLQFNPRIVAWADEVVSEIRKVVWPSRKDVTAMTVVVCVMVLISSAVVSSFDFVSGYMITALMK